MTDIGELRGATEAEIAKLRANGFETIEALEARIKEGRYGAIEQIAADTEIKKQRLIELLVARGEEPRRGVGRHVLATVGILLAFGALAALALLLGPALRPGDSVVTATRNLETGDVLRPDDLSRTVLLRGRDYFNVDPNELHGLVLARDVMAGRPLRHEDVLRPQVVAVKDLAAGTPVARGDVKLAWSAFEPAGLLQASAAVGHPLRRPLRKDQVVPSAAVAPIPTPQMAPQLQVVPTAGLAPYQVIRIEDVKLTVAPKQTAAVASLPAAEGRYALRAIPHGAVLRSGDLSEARLPASSLVGRHILSIPIRVENLSAAVVPGAQVSLLFSPYAHVLPGTTPRATPQTVPDAIVLDVTREGTRGAIVVAIRGEDLRAIRPLLGTSTVLVSRPAP